MRSTRFSKIDDEWVVAVKDTDPSVLGLQGETVQVTNRRGETKEPLLGEVARTDRAKHTVFYRIDRSRQEAGPASSKQLGFIAKLLRAVPDATHPDFSTITQGEASKLINELLAIRKKRDAERTRIDGYKAETPLPQDERMAVAW